MGEMTKERYEGILDMALEVNAIDLIFAVGDTPLWKITNKCILDIRGPELTPGDLKFIANQILFDRDVDFTKPGCNYICVTYDYKGIARFRCTIFKDVEHIRIVMRVIPLEIRSLADLNLPEQLAKLATLERGLVLVAGPTGNGKSTTISALLEIINQAQKVHVVTIEDPIEFRYKKAEALFTHREVGEHVIDYKTGVIEAMRMSPDVIMCGEIKDVGTFEAMLEAAESGHLVFSTTHASDTIGAFKRFMGFYPSTEKDNVMERLSLNLAAIISLRLLPCSNEHLRIKRVPAVELLQNTDYISELMRDTSSKGTIREAMQKGWDSREMWTFDQYMRELFNNNLIDRRTAISYATSPKEMDAMLIKDGVDLPAKKI